MSDWFLKKIWRDIKDPSWPEIEYWDDFLKLDKKIQQESLTRHNIHQELTDKFYNYDFWRMHVHAEFYQKDRFVFINIPKCGFMHHEDFFKNRLKWMKKDYPELYDQKNLVYFSLMMHPLKRYLKGLTEFIWSFHLQNSINLEKFVSDACFPDVHSMPYSILLRPEISKIHWIPFVDMTSIEVKKSMNALFRKYDSDLTIPTNHPSIHQSSDLKIQLFNDITSIWEKQYRGMYKVYLLHGPDIQFYKELIEQFKPDWSHIDIDLMQVDL